MAIIKNRLKDNFTQIPNELLTDNKLSMGAKIVFCYVASKPTGWEVFNKEIQKSLNIKDSGTMAKYWKELLEAGWIKRERQKQEDGKLAGGYIYELLEEPNTDEDRIGEKPVYTKSPCHNNTNLSNNTNINNNTNNSANQDNSNNVNGKLFSTNKEIKKPKQNGYIEIIQDLAKDQQIRDALLEYCNFRRRRGLTHEQWKAIVEQFKKESKGKQVEEIVRCIKQCLMNGRQTLYYTNYNRQDNNIPEPPTPDIEQSYFTKTDQF